MENLNTQSIIKAAGVGIGISLIIGILGGITGLIGLGTGIFWLLSCCGAVLIPVSIGALYGYFTPGKETLQQAAIGGAASGGAAGITYAIISSIGTAGTALYQTGDIGVALGNSTVNLVTSCCGGVLGGLLLGALGGVIWTAVQNR